MMEEIKAAVIPVMVTAAISSVSTFSIAVHEVSANGEQGKQNAAEIKEVQAVMVDVREKQAEMGAKIDLLVERAKLDR